MYQCKLPLDKPSSIAAAIAQPARMNHRAKTLRLRCSQSAPASRTSPDPGPALLPQSTQRPTPAPLHGCVRETIPDAAPGTPRLEPAPAVARREKLPPTCDGIAASRWPGSPDSWYEWP